MSTILPILMTYPPALDRALLPDGPVHAGHGPHKVVGGVAPRRGEADRPGEPAPYRIECLHFNVDVR